MSTGSRRKTAVTRLIQALALVAAFGGMLLVHRVAPDHHTEVGSVLGIGFLLLAGTLLSEVMETFGLPHLSGYLLAGVLAGPHVSHILSHEIVEQLSPVNTLALALIALAGGAELRLDTLRQAARSLAWATLTQSSIVFCGMALVFVGVASYIPFAREVGMKTLIGVALLWGVLAVSRSPSACLAILSQTRAKGKLATFSLAFVMLSDVVVVTLLAATMVVVRPLFNPSAGISLEDFSVLSHELLGSVAVGTTLGLLLAAYLRLVGREFLLVMLAMGFGLTEALRYISLDPLLTFLAAGFVVQNLSSQGTKLLREIEKISAVVFVVFFATAGAHLDLPLLRELWAITLVLCTARVLLTVVAGRLASRAARDGDVVRRLGWSSLVSQAGLTLGLAVVIERSFPFLGGGFRSLAIAAVAINEIVGPVIFKVALGRAQEIDVSAPAPRPSMASFHEDPAHGTLPP